MMCHWISSLFYMIRVSVRVCFSVLVLSFTYDHTGDSPLFLSFSLSLSVVEGIHRIYLSIFIFLVLSPLFCC